MTSSKELFHKGLCYIQRDIEDVEEALTYLADTISKLCNTATSTAQQSRLAKLNRYKSKLQTALARHKAELAYYIDYFSYTSEELYGANAKYPLRACTDEELEQDYLQDLQEVGYDTQQGKRKYTKQDHDEVLRKVNEFNKANDLPVVYWA